MITKLHAAVIESISKKESHESSQSFDPRNSNTKIISI